MTRASGSPQRSHEVRRTFFEFQGTEIWEILSGDSASGFLIPVGQLQTVVKDRLIPNISFEIENLTIGDGIQGNYLRIEPNSESDTEIFLAFMFCILPELCHCPSSETLPHFIQDRYETWAHFFGRKEIRGIDTSRFIGLFGELYTLRGAVRHFGPNAISNWWGPFQNRNDFEFDTFVAEIKTSMNLATNSVNVNGLAQFLDKHGRNVVLLLVRASPSISGETIEGVVDELAILGVKKSELENRLERVGSMEDLCRGSRELKFHVSSVSKYLVDANFPILRQEIIPASVRSRMSNVHYSIDLSGIDSSLFDVETGWEWL